MSRMQPVQPRSREMEIVRVLFDRHLLDRALNLAEARWPGSGDMIRLAYSWPELEPGERRQQLEDMGPERISEFRAFADLHPELAQVVDTLETRGGLTAPSQVVEQDPAPEPLIESSIAEPSEEPSLNIPPPSEEAAPVESSTDNGSLPEIEAFLDLEVADGFDEFRETARERHAEGLATGVETLERVRARLDESARRLVTSASKTPRASNRRPAMVTAPTGGARATLAVDDGHVTPLPGYWLEQLLAGQVVLADGRERPPTDDELVALANELGLELAEFHVEAGAARQIFGGLVRAGRVVEASVGPLPAALASPALVVIRGRMFAKQVQRLRVGFCDIPGTRATVRVDPEARVLILSG